jgi:hypothetical protein
VDAFESLVGTLLEHHGFWIRPSFKVELTAAEKQAIDRPSSPRWELDLVAYRASTNDVLMIECKSYLDSSGVRIGALNGDEGGFAKRFKLFNDAALLRVVRRRLVLQLVDGGFCRRRPKVTLCLAAARIVNEVHRAALKRLFRRKRWLLLDDGWLKGSLMMVAAGGYQNDIASVVAKLLVNRVRTRSASKATGPVVPDLALRLPKRPRSGR